MTATRSTRGARGDGPLAAWLAWAGGGRLARRPAGVGGEGAPPARAEGGQPGGRPLRGPAAVMVAGVVVVAAYLVGAAWSGSLDPVARRPLLDGLAPPPPYRWVEPPQGVPNSDKAPERGRFEVKLTGQGSEVGAFATGDSQVSLVLSEGAVPPREGDTSVVVEVQPVAASELAALPGGLLVTTNAYRVTATYQPSGEPAPQLGGQSTVTLTYALLTAPVSGASSHVILSTVDGQSWERLQTTDTAAAHQASAAFAGLGYYVVGVPPGSGETGGGGLDLTSILIPVVVAVALISIALLVLRRAETVTGGRGRQRRRPPPRGRRR